jgi:hypothetical protein
MPLPGYFVSSSRDPVLTQQINRVLNDIDDRLSELEFKASKTGKKPDISRAEKNALLYELGVMDFLLSKGISQKKIAALLSLILNSSQSNIEKDLSSRSNLDAPFKTKEVYKFVTRTFNELQIEELEKQSQTTLDKLDK